MDRAELVVALGHWRRRRRTAAAAEGSPTSPKRRSGAWFDPVLGLGEVERDGGKRLEARDEAPRIGERRTSAMRGSAATASVSARKKAKERGQRG